MNKIDKNSRGSTYGMFEEANGHREYEMLHKRIKPQERSRLRLIRVGVVIQNMLDWVVLGPMDSYGLDLYRIKNSVKGFYRDKKILEVIETLQRLERRKNNRGEQFSTTRKYFLFRKLAVRSFKMYYEKNRYTIWHI